MRRSAYWLRCFPITYFCIIARRRSNAFGTEYVFPEGRKMAAALRAEFREKSFVVLAHHLDDFIVGHGAIVSPPTPSAFAGVIRGTPVPSLGAMGRQRSQRFCYFLLFADPGGIGFAQMKYALHFIGQAFHRAGPPKSKTTQPFG
jgi:hypothetical protein